MYRNVCRQTLLNVCRQTLLSMARPNSRDVMTAIGCDQKEFNVINTPNITEHCLDGKQMKKQQMFHLSIGR